MWLRSSNLTVDEFPPKLSLHWGHFTNISLLLPSTLEVDIFFCMSLLVWSRSKLFVFSKDLSFIGSEILGLSSSFFTGKPGEGNFLVNCGGSAGLAIVAANLTPSPLLLTFATTLIFSDWRGTAVCRGTVMLFGGCLFWPPPWLVWLPNFLFWTPPWLVWMPDFLFWIPPWLFWMLGFLFWMSACSFWSPAFSPRATILTAKPRPYLSAIFEVSSSGCMVGGLMLYLSLSEDDFLASGIEAEGVVLQSTVGEGLK